MNKPGKLFYLTILLLLLFTIKNVDGADVSPRSSAKNQIVYPQNTHELDDEGGPDGFGYVWRDSNEPGGPVYNWEDISFTGTMLGISNDNDNTELVTLPFDFLFYGNLFNEVNISTNGLIYFGIPEADENNTSLPDAAGPAGIIAPFWDDFNPAAAGEIYYDGDVNRFIVQWESVERFFEPGQLYTFQAILYPDGTIRFQYNSLGVTINSCTVGIEDIDETTGLEIAFNNIYLADLLAIDLYPPPSNFALLTPPDRDLCTGGDTTLTWQISTVADPENQVDEYWTWWATDELFTLNLDSVSSAGTSVNLTALSHNETYWWKVRAQDQLTGGTWSDETWRLHVFNPVAPDAFNLNEPLDNTDVNIDSLVFSWNSSYDQNIDNGLQLLGGDAFGYDWITNNQPGGPRFNWIDISGTGILSTTSLVANSTEEVLLPFSFNYYGNFYNQVNISSNGNLHFGTASGDFSNSGIPNGDGPSAMIAPFWDALRPDIQGDIYYESFVDRFIVQWQDVQRFADPLSSLTFQVILEANGSILFQYSSLSGTLNSCTAGIENPAENDGIEVVFDSDYLDDGLAVWFSTNTYYYELQVSDDPLFTSYTNFTTTDTFQFFDSILGSGFIDDETYFWRVRAKNSFNQSTFASPVNGWSFDTDIFEPPDAFSLMSPLDNFVSPTYSATLQWNATTDPDPGDIVTYEVYVSEDSLDLGLPVATGLTVTTYEFSGNSDTEYFWSIKAIDTNTPGTWANETWSFSTAEFQPPDAFNLLDPVDGFISDITSVNLDWSIATDPDPGDFVTYDVYVSTSPIDLGIPVATGLAVTNYTFIGTDDTQYWWRILANDSFGFSTWSDDLWSFSIAVPEPPSPFSMLLPADGTELDNGLVSLSWEASIDPDPGDNVTYEVYVSTDQGDLGLPVASGLNLTWYDFTGVDNTVYYWRIKAIDSNSPGVWATDQWSFIVDIPQAPGQFSLLLPDSGTVSADTTITFIWEEPIDPDITEDLTYEIYISENPLDLGPPVATGLTNTFYIFDGEDDTEYWWRVRAVDSDLLTVWSTELWSISIYYADLPYAFDLVAPPDGWGTNDTEISLVWRSTSDPDPGDSIYYDVYVSTNPDDLGPPIASGLTDTTYLYTGMDNTVYHWRIHAVDTNTGGRLSAKWDFAIALPQDPDPFNLVSPADGYLSTVQDIELTWNAATDPDPGDILFYEVFVSTDPFDFGLPVETDIYDTTYTFTAPADTIYYWRIRAVDLDLLESWSIETWSFTVDTPTAPDPFDLFSPEDGYISPSTDVILLWEPTTDPDPDDEVTYEVHVSTDQDDLGAPVAIGLLLSNYTFAAIDDESYYWSIRAADLNSPGTWANDTLSFSVYEPEPPLDFDLLNPVNGETVIVLNPTLSWESTTDPDPGDVLTYTVEWALDEDFTDATIIAGLTDNFYIIPLLPDNSTVYWRVHAVDLNTAGTWSGPDPYWSFDVEYEQPPSPFSLISPPDGSLSEVDGTVALEWENNGDPDPDQDVLYYIHLSETAGFIDETVIGPYNEGEFPVLNEAWLTDETWYWWKIRAVDETLAETWSTESWSFFVHIPNMPDPFDLIFPGDDDTSETIEITFTWENNGDPDFGQEVQYNVHISEDPIFFLNHVYGPYGEGVFPTIIEPWLEDDRQYWWRVFAYDAELDDSTQSNTINGFRTYVPESPASFNLLTPLNGTLTDDYTPTLTWEETTDPDPGDFITYTVEWATDPDFSDVAYVTGLNEAEVTFPGGVIEENTTIYWHVLAVDQNTDGTWSGPDSVWHFTVTDELLPNSFNLISPANGDTSFDGSMAFDWEHNGDPDEGQEVQYTIHLGEDPAFNIEHVYGPYDEDVLNPVISAPFMTDGALVWWRVFALDAVLDDSVESDESRWFSVFIPDPPEDFSKLSPENGAVVDTLGPTLTWQTAEDVDPGDEITYSLEWSLSDDFTNSTLIEGIADTFYTFEEELVFQAFENQNWNKDELDELLPDDVDIYWRLFAIDSFGEITIAGPEPDWVFSVYYPEPPGSFHLLFPPNGSQEPDPQITLVWESPVDPDPGEEVTYDLYLREGDGVFQGIALGLTDTIHTVNLWNDDQDWSWTILAEDETGAQTWALDTLNFQTYFPEPPGIFRLYSPENNALIHTPTVHLEWEESEDPDPGDPITYTVVVSMPDTEPWIAGQDIDTTFFNYEFPFDDTTYTWRIRATDTNTPGTWSVQTWDFSTEIYELPTTFDLSLPTDESLVETSTPTFAWYSSIDLNEGVPITYNLIWSINDPGFTDPDSVVSIADTFYTLTEDVLLGKNRDKGEQLIKSSKQAINGSILERNKSAKELDELPDDVIVYWYVRAVDGLTFGRPSNQNPIDNNSYSFGISIPQTPESFGLLSPQNYDVIQNSEVVLEWESTVDPDPGDEITYDLYISLMPFDEDPGNPYATGITDTSFTFGAVDDSTYYWTIHARDTNSEGTWADGISTFSIGVPEAPSQFELAFPVEGDLVIGVAPELAWYRSYDPDPVDSVLSYTIYWSNEPDFSELDSITGIPDTFYVWDTTSILQRSGNRTRKNNNGLSAKLSFAGNDDREESTNELDSEGNNETIYWKVKAVDSNTAGTFADPEDGWFFERYIYNAPEAFSLIHPDFGDIINTSNIDFSWKPAHDEVTEDSIEYFVEISHTSGFSDPLLISTGSDTIVEIPDFDDDQSYWWRVKALDTFLRETISEESRLFSVSIPEPPSTFNLLEPEDSSQVAWSVPNEINFQWERSIDPDPEDNLVIYATEFIIHLTDSTSVTIELENLTGTNFWINIADSAGIVSWHDPLEVNWFVTAVSGGDTTWCRETYNFWLENPEDELSWLPSGVPEKFSVVAAYPNPFNTAIEMVIGVPVSGKLKVEIYDLLGRQVAKLADRSYEAGYHRLIWNATYNAAGIYFIRAVSKDGRSEIKKIFYVK